ncbi:long-chain fatty acid--CoA ligase [Rhodococcus sp. SRB_17]|nr:long-chain fatty acid--CoA ligase [Rhodococcus sp. SRB_17]
MTANPQLRHSMRYPDTTMAYWAPSMVALYGDRIAVVDGERTCTFRELGKRSAQFAGGLRRAGIVPGDVVLLHLGNCIEFLEAYYGSLQAGTTVTLVNPLQPEPGLRKQIDETSAVAAVTQDAQLPTLLRASSGTSIRAIVTVRDSESSIHEQDPRIVTFDAFLAGLPTQFTPVSVGGEGIAHIAFTGGTTGVSKGVRVLHRNVVGNITQMCGWRTGHELEVGVDGLVTPRPIDDLDVLGPTPGTGATIVVSPLFHAHSLLNTSFLLISGLTQVFAGRFEPGRMLELIESHKATYLTGSPTMWNALSIHPDATVRNTDSVCVVSSGAAPIDSVTLTALRLVFPKALVVEGYGLTEATCVVTAAPLVNGAEYRQGSVGLPIFDTEVQIRDQTDRRTVLGRNERGELWVRGPQVTDGYLGHPLATAEQFSDGWLDTGDIAYRDSDGYIFICDRAKDMLIYKGYNVYPRELEEILVSHPAISTAAVVGRAVGSKGQEPVAFVVTIPGFEFDAEQIKTFVAEQVLPYKKIRDVIEVELLPTSATGKVLKTDLRSRLLEATHRTDGSR